MSRLTYAPRSKRYKNVAIGIGLLLVAMAMVYIGHRDRAQQLLAGIVFVGGYYYLRKPISPDGSALTSQNSSDPDAISINGTFDKPNDRPDPWVWRLGAAMLLLIVITCCCFYFYWVYTNQQLVWPVYLFAGVMTVSGIILSCLVGIVFRRMLSNNK